MANQGLLSIYVIEEYKILYAMVYKILVSITKLVDCRDSLRHEA